MFNLEIIIGIILLLVIKIVYNIDSFIPNKCNYIFIHENGTFKKEVIEILEKSNIKAKHRLCFTNNIKNANIIMQLVKREDMENKHLTLSGSKGNTTLDKNGNKVYFSFTVNYKNKPSQICIDETNWQTGASSGLTIDKYRKYVIQHEVLHGLGYDHQPCNKETAEKDICPVMYQATKGPPIGFKSGYIVRDIDYSKKL